MLCPRCRLPLRTVEYEGVEADMCDACWGFWLDCGELEEVIRNQDLSFSTQERDRILDVRGASAAGPTEPAPCPECGRVMSRVHYDSMIHLIIDRCQDHGVWLDTGEIKKVQALAARHGEYHTILLKKLGLIAQT